MKEILMLVLFLALFLHFSVGAAHPADVGGGPTQHHSVQPLCDVGGGPTCGG